MNLPSVDNIKVFFAFNFFIFLSCFRPHWPIAVLYYQSIMNSYASAMIIFSIIFLSQSILEVPTGLISDLLGRRKTMIVGALFSFVALFYMQLDLIFGCYSQVHFVKAWGDHFLVVQIKHCYTRLCRNKNSQANLNLFLARSALSSKLP